MSVLPERTSTLGHQPLSNRRWEAFCHALSRAAAPSLVEAYYEASDAIGCRRPSHNAARVAASNLARKSVVVDRTAFLREKRLDGVESPSDRLDQRRIHDLLEACTETLVSAVKAAEKAGLGVSQVSAIRKSILVHEGRRLRSRKFIPNAPITEATHNWDIPDWCSCSPEVRLRGPLQKAIQ